MEASYEKLSIQVKSNCGTILTGMKALVIDAKTWSDDANANLKHLICNVD
ncbi:11106_t:CDS:2 [Rhizophagus irregularis]|nr:11106_t:CDS:2 [Rhizophagus irregularis]